MTIYIKSAEGDVISTDDNCYENAIYFIATNSKQSSIFCNESTKWSFTALGTTISGITE